MSEEDKSAKARYKCEVRLTAEALRYKYARIHKLTRDWVKIEYFEHKDKTIDARIYAAKQGDWPVWTVGRPDAGI